MHAILAQPRSEQAGPGLLRYLPAEAGRIEVAQKYGIGIDVLEGLSAEAKQEIKKVYDRDKPINVKEAFEFAVSKYGDYNHGDRNVLIVIDEFETITDRSTIAPYLKSSEARFILVGVAANLLEVVSEHASVGRDIHSINLGPMVDTELLEILQVGSLRLSPYCTFADDAMQEIAERSSGSPFWSHALGKSLLSEWVDSLADFSRLFSERKTFQKADVNSLMARLPHLPNNRGWEEILQGIVQGDTTIGRILLSISQRSEAEIRSSALQSIEEIGRDQIVAIVTDIIRMQDSPLRETRRIGTTFSFVFTDPIFRRYVVLRNAGLPATV